jgi:hypothetical protein
MTIRTLRLPLAIAVEVMWSYAAMAIAVAVLGQDGSAPSVIGVAAAVIGSFALVRALQQTDLSEVQLRNIGVVASVVAIFAIVHFEYAATAPPWDLAWLRAVATQNDDIRPDVIVATVGLALIWMRGIARGRETLSFDGVLRGTAFGMVPIVIAAGFASELDGPNIFGPLAIAYLLVAAAALALYQAPDPDRPVRNYVAQWGAAAVIVLAAAAVLTVVAAAIDPGALGVLSPVGRPLAFVFGNAARYILGPPLAGIAWLFGLIPLPHVHQDEMPQMMPSNTPPEKQPNDDSAPAWARILGRILAGGGIALLVGLALFAVWLLFRRFAKPKDQTNERRERVEPDSSLADDLGDLLDALARRFRRGSKPNTTVAVRRLYFDMLEGGATAGLERPPAATPLQFAPSLDAHYASDVPSAITQAFVDSRYGAHEFDEDSVNTLRRRWEQVERSMP